MQLGRPIPALAAVSSQNIVRTASAAEEPAADRLKLNGFAITKADEFDDQRVAALLAAAWGDELARATLAYLRGVLANQ